MKQEEHDSQSLFEGKTAPVPEAQEQPSKGLGAVGKIAIVAALVVCVAAVIIFKHSGNSRKTEFGGDTSIGESGGDTGIPSSSEGPVATAGDSERSVNIVSDGRALPRLIELGSVSCFPCQMMAPILDELRREYPDTLIVEFIDIKKNEEAGEKFGVNLMPTQVFLDAEGKELFRHEGFFPKAEILAKWKELGVDLRAAKKE